LARKILLADDSVTAQNMGRKILADAGYEVITVNNGSAALKKIAEHKPDLIILDVYMPGYSGLEVCQRLKEVPETARTPVLLTVGKLEPFKPEEAKRVRAEGFIVKPFEASELLTALSKLEDKIVPRAEPSKPGRFARTFAAVEESNRNVANAGEDSGWKNRIAFPSKKSQGDAGERPVDDAAQEVARTSDGTVAVSALAPAEMPKNILPKDVTLEEVAAMAAAAAQVHRTAAAKNSESAVASIAAQAEIVPETKPAQEPVEIRSAEEIAGSATFATHKQQEDKIEAPEIRTQTEENQKDTSGSSRDEVVAAISALGSGNGHSRSELADLPVTMAAAAEGTGGPRWTAVPAAIDAAEAANSLEQEMRQSQAAVIAAQTDQAESGTATAAAQQSTESSPVEPAPVAESVARAATYEESELGQALSAVANAPVVALSAVATELAAVAGSQVEALVSTAAPETFASSSTPSTETSQPESGNKLQEETQPHQPNVAEQAAPEEGQRPGFGEEAAPSPVQETSSTSPQEPQSAEMVSAVAEAPVKNESAAGGTGEMAAKKDTELAETTAAAWASWRQIRNTGDANPSGSDVAKSNREEKEEDDTESSAPAAMAVAAGAEKNPEESRSSSDPRAIASIVDSVLAELRPKIVEEISRKLGEKK
jgi:CheY-like chemotaxis protein